MFEFSSSLDGMPESKALKIIRCPDRGQLEGMILNDSVTCHAMHYVAKRTVPHTENGPCQYCSPQNDFKLEVFVPIWNMMADTQRILTLTDFAAQSLLQYAQDRGNLRGHIIKCWRPTQHKFGRIECQVYPIGELVSVCPPPVDVEKHLMMVWNVNMAELANSSRQLPAGDNLANLRG